MAKIFLLSIKPVYARAILSGSKRFELRRGEGRDFSAGDIVVMYASGRYKKIVGEFMVGKIYRGSPHHVWRIVTQSKDYGITGESWRYIMGSSRAFALEVKDPRPYRQTLSLYDIRNIFPYWNPPMGYELLGKGNPIYELLIEPLRKKEGLEERKFKG